MYVRYDPSAVGATLQGAIERFAVVEVEGANGKTVVFGTLATGSDGVILGFPVALPPDAERGRVRFFTLDPSLPTDDLANLSFTVVRPDGHGIVAGMSRDEIDQRVASHRAAHADDATVWFAKWRALEPITRDDELAGTIRADLLAIESSGADVPAARFVRAWALLRVGDDAKGMDAVEELITVFPTDPWTGRAVEALALVRERDSSNRWRGLALRYAEANPGGPALRHGLLAALVAEPSVPLETIDRCTNAWSVEQPADPMPLLLAVEARRVRNADLAACDGMAAKAFELLATPGYRALCDPRNEFAAGIACELLDIRAAAAEARGDSSAKLLYGLARKGVAAGGLGTPSNSTPDGAMAWKAAAGLGAAPPAPTAPQAAAVIAAGPATPAPATTEPASEVVDTSKPSGADLGEVMLMDLDGNLVRLADFLGKVVVVNLWFTGCGPCKQEMPRLNELVDRFQNKDVVFLAPSLDGAAKSRAVVEERGFRYRVLTDAMPFAQAVGVTAYPTHLVIDRQGKVALTRTGTGDAVEAEVAAAVERLLQ